MNTLTDAVTHLERGDWEAAHRIVQDDESRSGCWAHAIVHLMEGDLDNAGYWFRRAGRPMPDLSGSDAARADAIAAEIAALRSQA